MWERASTPVQPSNARQLLPLLLHLLEFQFNRSRTSEDRDHHFQRFTVFIDVVHDASESCERPFADPYRLAFFEFDFKLRTVFRLASFVNYMLNFFFRKWRGLLPVRDKSRDS